MAETFVQNESIETVIQRYKGTVYSVALSYVSSRDDADDIFQEVFLIYFRTNPQFNDEEHRKAWLIRTTINCSKRVVDSTYRKRTVPMDEMEEESFEFQTKEENAVYVALQALPEKYRTVLHLFYFEDLSIDMICKVLDLKSSTVKVQLMRGREMMKEKLKEEGYND
ncbi:MAG: sigma-70 family RNA polymerase sigma factor [Firmicutes bacterium]|nr:sigma-70 family RNA polymerase sigma factor [Bacillota bacterium]MBR5488529.1 sigma-70 family RNA polymerase sigma factor [Bacillota bacterium]